MQPGFLWRLLVGPPLATARLQHERLDVWRGLAVFGSDALSSAAYGPEEVLRGLVVAGAAGLALAPAVGLAIALLVVVVAVSYYQTVHAYPTGGGAYVVARENLGLRVGLVAAAALLVDYVLTVAVSISAGVAAIASAFPELGPYRVELAAGLIAFMTVVNLRGVRESGTFFAVPAYAFVASLGMVLLAGFLAMVRGALPQVEPWPVVAAERSLGSLELLRAFAGGTAALTGIEAVANGVQAFREPAARNAGRVLVAMAALLALFVAGVLLLSREMGVVPLDEETVVSQIARALFGSSPAYYAVQFSTLAILVVAANTAFADFPRLAAILARDEFMPHQLANLGDRLVFANGILLLGGLASLVVVLFGAVVHHLIPLYMVGVFVAFTVSQLGMVRHWARVRGPWWQAKAALNAFGAACTAVVGVEVGVVKFVEGAWVTLFLVGALVFGMRYVERHYVTVRRLLAVDRARPARPVRVHKVVLLVGDVHRGVLEAVRYAQAIGDDVTAVFVAVDPVVGEEMRARWARHVPWVPLVVLPSPYRSVVRPVLEYLDRLEAEAGPGAVITVVLPEFVPRHWWDNLLHNQTALALKLALLYRGRKKGRHRVVADVPYYLAR